MERSEFFKGIHVGYGFDFHNPKDWYDDNLISIFKNAENCYTLISMDEKNKSENLTSEEIENHETSFGCTIGELIDGLKDMRIYIGENGNGEEFKIKL